MRVGKREITPMWMRGIDMRIVYYPRIFQSPYFYYTTKLYLRTS